MTEIELTNLMGPVPEFSGENLANNDQSFPVGLILMSGLLIGGIVVYMILQLDNKQTSIERKS